MPQAVSLLGQGHLTNLTAFITGSSLPGQRYVTALITGILLLEQICITAKVRPDVTGKVRQTVSDNVTAVVP